MHLVINKSGDWAFNTHAHESGVDNIDYMITGVLVSTTQPGLAISFTHQGGVEGTSAGLPFGTPRRDDDSSFSGNNPIIRDEWDNWQSASFAGAIDGSDALVGGLEALIAAAGKAAASAAAVAAVTAIVAVL